MVVQEGLSAVQVGVRGVENTGGALLDPSIEEPGGDDISRVSRWGALVSGKSDSGYIGRSLGRSPSPGSEDGKFVRYVRHPVAQPPS